MADYGFFDLDVQGDVTRAEAFLEEFGAQAKPVLSRISKRTAVGMKTAASMETRKVYGVKAKKLKEAMNVQAGLLRSVITVKGPALGLMNFSPRPTAPGRKPRRGASHLIRKDVGRVAIAGAFVARMPQGGVIQAKRVGKSAYPIKKLFGPSVAQMVGNKGVVESVLAIGQERYVREFDHEVSRALTKWGVR